MIADCISKFLRGPAGRQWLVAMCLVLAAAPVYAQAAFNPFDWICAALDIIKGPLAAAGFLIAAAVFLILLMAGEHNRGVSTFLLIGLCVTALVGVDQLGKTFWPRLAFLC
jgi:hypothetical protein